MFIPYRDENPTRRFAVVTAALIVINIIAFYIQISSPQGFDVTTRQYGLIPLELTKGKNLPGSTMVNPYLTLVTYMFCHGGIAHLVFNMLFLWIFGNNVEDRMSRAGFLAFYLITGVVSALAFQVLYPATEMPLVGASGAISGVLGAYLIMFPFARLHVWMLLFVIRMPAMVFLPIWFALQIFGFMNGGSGADGNVAWVSHIAGFVAGIVLYRVFAVKQARRAG